MPGRCLRRPAWSPKAWQTRPARLVESRRSGGPCRPGLRQIAILATPIPLLSGPLLLLFITQFPRRGSARLALLVSLPALLISPFTAYFVLYGDLLPDPAVALAAPAWLVPVQGLSSLIAIVGAIVTGIK